MKIWIFNGSAAFGQKHFPRQSFDQQEQGKQRLGEYKKRLVI
jgi:hypothetical protein